MATDLVDLIPSLKRALSEPGSEDSIYPDATDETYEGMLADAFWSAKLDGLLSGYDLDGSMVSPDLPGELGQLIVLYAAMNSVYNRVMNIQTTFRAKAGPVEFETQQSASVLKALLDDLRARREYLLKSLSASGIIRDVYIDAVAARADSISYGATYWAK